jgi:uncharacterized protein (DUF1697 family)
MSRCYAGFSVLGLTRVIEERYGVTVTTRNWNTVNRLAGWARASQ